MRSVAAAAAVVGVVSVSVVGVISVSVVGVASVAVEEGAGSSEGDGVGDLGLTIGDHVQHDTAYSSW